MKFPRGLIKIGILSTGAFMGPLLMLLATPFLSRIYSPEDFGYLALFTSVASVLVVVSCLRYEGAIQAVSDNNFGIMVNLALLSVFIVLALEMLALASGLPQIKFEPLIQLGSDVKFLPIVSAAGGILLIVANVTLRQGRYLRNAAARSLTTIFFISLALAIPSNGLVNASITASLLAGVVGLIYLFIFFRFRSVSNILVLAKKYIEYPLFLAPTSLLDTMALSLPVLFISGSYGVDTVGYYTQIQRLLGAPIILLGVVAAQLFSKQCGELFRSERRSKKLLWKTIGLLSTASLTLFFFSLLFGQTIFQYILGEAWKVDNRFLILALIPCLVRSTISPISYIFIAYQKIKYLVIWQVGYFIFTYGVLYYAASTMQFENFLITYIILDVTMYLIYLILASYVSNLQINSSRG